MAADRRRETGTKKPSISVIGAGNWGTALAWALHRAGYPVREVVGRPGSAPSRRDRALARAVKAKATSMDGAALDADVLILCVPDDAVEAVASALGERPLQRRVVWHSSGALASRVLEPAARAGASVASVHPMMTFVARRPVDLAGVTFAVEGDAKAVRVAVRVVRDIGGVPLRLQTEHKTLYHVLGAFCSPMLLATLVCAEVAGRRGAGLSAAAVRRLMRPIVGRTVDNFFERGSGRSFSGPLARGDARTVQRHLEALRGTPDLLQAYKALGLVALERLPAKGAPTTRKLLKS